MSWAGVWTVTTSGIDAVRTANSWYTSAALPISPTESGTPPGGLHHQRHGFFQVVHHPVDVSVSRRRFARQGSTSTISPTPSFIGTASG